MKELFSFCCFLAVAISAFNSTAAADLKSDMRDFASLVPRRRIRFIAARHLIVDSHFRSALSYIRGPDFPITWQQVRKTPEFAEIVTYVTMHGSGYDITSIIDYLPNRLRNFRISTQVPVALMLQRNLSTFLREVVASLPRGRISSLMFTKAKEGGEFAALYKALRSDEFRKLVDTARNAPSLQGPINELTNNFIKVDDLIEIGFSILRWGPDPARIP